MITYKPIIIPGGKRNDGTYPVKIRVTFKGVSRRLPTTLVCRPQDLTRTLKIKSADIISKANVLIDQMRKVTDELSPFDLESHDVDWVVLKMKEGLTSETFHLDFFEWADKYILTKTATTRRAYSCALNTFERFLGERRIDINSITRTLLMDFVEFVDNEPKMHYDVKSGTMVASGKEKIARGASSRHLMKLANIYNSAKDRYNDEDSGRIPIPRSPFSTITKVFPHSQGQKNLGVELMQRIISSQTDNLNERRCLDAFILSFLLMGANMADLYTAKPLTGEWRYNRKKTESRRADKAEMRVTIPEEALPYIARLQEARGAWWLPVLHQMAKDKDLCTALVNRGLKRWCVKNGVEVFTFYAARHTWATLARKAGVEKSLIDDCLAHKGDFSMVDIYAEKDWTLINEANRKVIDLFVW